MTHASLDPELAALCSSWSTEPWQRLTATEAAATPPRPGRVANPDASPNPDASLALVVHRAAEMHPDCAAGPLPARVYWPAPTTPGATVPALLMVFHADGFVPGSVHSVECDPLRDDGRRRAARLRQAGVEVEELRCRGLVHGTLALFGCVGAAGRLRTDHTHAPYRPVKARSPPTVADWS